jgi:calmodulin
MNKEAEEGEEEEEGNCDVCPYHLKPLPCSLENAATVCVVEDPVSLKMVHVGECLISEEAGEEAGLCACSVWNVCTKGEEGEEDKGCEEDEECSSEEGEEVERGGGGSPVYKCEVEEEEDVPMQLKVVLLVLFALILLSIAFEQGKDYLFESTSRNLKPIVESLFGELTVLGFIGVIMFFVGQAPWLSSMSMTLFAEEELLKELIEQVHMSLFIVMVIFLSTVITLLQFANNIAKTWKEWEEVSLGEHEEIVNNHLEVMKTKQSHSMYQTVTSFVSNNTFFTPHNNSVMARHFYICMRLHFAAAMTKQEQEQEEKEGKKKKKIKQPINGEKADVDLDTVRESFDFAEYLCIIQGKVLSEIVEVSWQTWALLGLIFLLGWLVIFTLGVKYEVLLILFIGFAICFIDFYVQHHLMHIHHSIAACHPIHDKLMRRKEGLVKVRHSKGHEDALLNKASTSDLELGGENVNLEAWMNKLIIGPPKILFLIRVILLMLSIYIALFIQYVGVQLVKIAKHGYVGAGETFAVFEMSSATALALFLIGVLPILLVLMHIPSTVRDLVIVENVIKRKGRFVEMVRRRQKTARAFRILRLAMQIKYCLKHNMAAPEKHYRYIRFTPLKARPKEQDSGASHEQTTGQKIVLDSITFFNDRRQRVAIQEQWGDPKKLVTRDKPKNKPLHVRANSESEHSPHAGSSHFSPTRAGKQFKPKTFFGDHDPHVKGTVVFDLGESEGRGGFAVSSEDDGRTTPTSHLSANSIAGYQIVTSASRDAISVYTDPVRWLLEGSNDDPAGVAGADGVEWVVLHDASKIDFQVPMERASRIKISPLSGYQDVSEPMHTNMSPSINGSPASPGPSIGGGGGSSTQKMTNKNKESLFSVFRCFDTDGGGTLGLAEIESFLEKINPGNFMEDDDDGNGRGMVSTLGFSPAECRQVFRAIDYDGSGEVEFDEFCEWVTRVAAQVPTCIVIKGMFNMIDNSKERAVDMDQIELEEEEEEEEEEDDDPEHMGDNLITLSELADAFRRTGSSFEEDHVQEIMRDIDKNGDGCLDIEEFTHLVNSLIDGDFHKTAADKKND